MCRNYYLKLLTEDCLYTKNVITKFGSMLDWQIKAPFYSTQMKHVFSLWLSPYLSCRKGQAFQECPLHGCMAQFDHHHTSTVRSHPFDDSRPSPTTESYASETSHSEFSLPILHHIPITHKQQVLSCKSTCLLLRNIFLRGPSFGSKEN